MAARLASNTDVTTRQWRFGIPDPGSSPGHLDKADTPNFWRTAPKLPAASARQRHQGAVTGERDTPTGWR